MKKLVLALLIIASVASARYMSCQEMLPHIDGSYGPRGDMEFTIHDLMYHINEYTCGSADNNWYYAIWKEGNIIYGWRPGSNTVSVVAWNQYDHIGKAVFVSNDKLTDFMPIFQINSQAAFNRHKKAVKKAIKNY